MRNLVKTNVERITEYVILTKDDCISSAIILMRVQTREILSGFFVVNNLSFQAIINFGISDHSTNKFTTKKLGGGKFYDKVK